MLYVYDDFSFHEISNDFFNRIEIFRFTIVIFDFFVANALFFLMSFKMKIFRFTMVIFDFSLQMYSFFDVFQNEPFLEKKRNCEKVVLHWKWIGFSISFWIHNFFWKKKTFCWLVFLPEIKIYHFLKRYLDMINVRKMNQKSSNLVKKPPRGFHKKLSPAPRGGQTRAPKTTFFEKSFVKKIQAVPKQ